MAGQVGETNYHNFYERLAFSNNHKNESFWQKIYKKAFSNLEFSKPCVNKCQGQYSGIDRVVQLKSGKTLYIDEKLRENDYADILLEYRSNDKLDKPGWINKDLLIDFLAYAFLPSKRCYLFNWELLRNAWKREAKKWYKQYPIITARNKNYNTLSLAIPTDVLLNEVKNSSVIVLD